MAAVWAARGHARGWPRPAFDRLAGLGPGGARWRHGRFRCGPVCAGRYSRRGRRSVRADRQRSRCCGPVRANTDGAAQLPRPRPARGASCHARCRHARPAGRRRRSLALAGAAGPAGWGRDVPRCRGRGLARRTAARAAGRRRRGERARPLRCASRPPAYPGRSTMVPTTMVPRRGGPAHSAATLCMQVRASCSAR